MTAGILSMDTLPLTTILIIPFSELGTKSAASRTKMMDQLLTNIKHVLKDVFSIPWTKFRVLDERLVFSFKERKETSNAILALQHVPGILRLYACMETQTNPTMISKKIEMLLTHSHIQLDPDHIEIRALYLTDQGLKKRLIDQVGSVLHGLIAMQQAMEFPRSPAYVEMHPDFSYVSIEHHAGLNGNPVGSENPVLAEIIGRPGDLMASLLAIKRGVVLTPVFFSIGGNAIDAVVYNDLLKYINKIIALFHGFPVKKIFFVHLEKIQELLHENLHDLMDQNPCACCILSRYQIMARILEEHHMVPFIIQGLANSGGLSIATCPANKSLDPALNVTNFVLANPLFTNQQSWPSIFSQYYANCPVNADESTGYSWNFCKLWKDVSLSHLEQDRLVEVVNFLNNRVLKDFPSLVKQIDDSFDFDV